MIVTEVDRFGVCINKLWSLGEYVVTVTKRPGSPLPRPLRGFWDGDSFPAIADARKSIIRAAHELGAKFVVDS